MKKTDDKKPVPSVSVTTSTGNSTNWRAWYWLVLGALAVEIGFFAYLTRLFA
ncbi:hypothetical protein MUN82_02535 [Hymenobacter aerilatus]|uniref:Uncharacterized protein n=1 Tax=Hymenobacter aerilatus TaxID=2932251 RepID=A0A8T9T1W6_9BACT|nr:hypothetical protein [Hymenobacter aerilatus]UOR05989.1 hypothetical protein MUN82_02535 [Hymenobacter aerilatus]